MGRDGAGRPLLQKRRIATACEGQLQDRLGRMRLEVGAVGRWASAVGVSLWDALADARTHWHRGVK